MLKSNERKSVFVVQLLEIRVLLEFSKWHKITLASVSFTIQYFQLYFRKTF